MPGLCCVSRQGLPQLGVVQDLDEHDLPDELGDEFREQFAHQGLLHSVPSRSGQCVLRLCGQGGDEVGCGGQVGDEVDGLAGPHR
jgi:hypothetical protein